MKNPCFASLSCAILAAVFAFNVFAEEEYAFRKRLEIVHENGRRDMSLAARSDEFEFRNGFVIELPSCATPFMRRCARDFAEYLAESMGISARVSFDGVRGGKNVLVAQRLCDLPPESGMKLKERSYSVEVDSDGVKLVGFDERALAQAFYHLEDMMNLRRAPYLKHARRVRTPRFAVRMTHSGYGNDIFPEAHLNAMAHAGMTAILVFLDDIDKTKAQDYQDLKALIRLAAKYGLDTYLYSYIKAFAHPDDGAKVFEESYGRIAGHYPEAKGIILVGESCQFPSKDPRVQPRTWRNKDANDKRPLAGWFPCVDYPDWLRAVQKAIHAKAPEMELVFWTYNWGWAPLEDRRKLIRAIPGDVTLMATFEMFERCMKRNGIDSPTADYTLSFAGPGKYFRSEAVEAKKRGLKLYTQANAGGVTWDYGTVPYQPCPYQWKRRWDGLVASNIDYGLSGIMENHHFGWWPSFISELEKEAFTEGGIPFDEHIRLIAARDYGAENVDTVIAYWKKWSELAADYVPTDANQYGPFRIGPSYPFTFGHPPVGYESFPVNKYASNGIRICRFDYLKSSFVAQLTPERMDAQYMAKEIELLEPMAEAYEKGAAAFGKMSGEKAANMANFAAYLGACTRTAINTKRGAIAFLSKDDALVLEAARDEYRNAKEAIKYVRADSRLGWEPSMEYVGAERQIRWKLSLMEKLYGFSAE